MDVNDMYKQDNIPVPNQQTKQKKCHGNRRDQRLRRKCRDQKMQPAKIEKLIKKRNRIHKKHQKNISATHHTTNANIQSTTRKHNEDSTITTTTTNINKRKRDISQQQLSKTTDSISILQPLSKKTKHITQTVNSNSIINMNIHANYQYVFLKIST
jgi:hypothetical protein